MTRLPLVPVQLPGKFPGMVSRSWRKGCGEAPELFPETGGGGEHSWSILLAALCAGPLPPAVCGASFVYL